MSEKKMLYHAKRGSYSEEAAYRRVHGAYVASAKKKDLTWGLTFEQSFALFKVPCFYCGQLPSNRIHYNNHEINHFYNGIDRVDNTRGYELGNVVTCCKPCNMGKGRQTQEEFLAQIIRIFNKHCR